MTFPFLSKLVRFRSLLDRLDVLRDKGPDLTENYDRLKGLQYLEASVVSRVLLRQYYYWKMWVIDQNSTISIGRTNCIVFPQLKKNLDWNCKLFCTRCAIIKFGLSLHIYLHIVSSLSLIIFLKTIVWGTLEVCYSCRWLGIALENRRERLSNSTSSRNSKHILRIRYNSGRNNERFNLWAKVRNA